MVLWDVAARKRLVDEPLPVKEGDVTSVAFSPDGKTIAAGYERVDDRTGVVLWDVAARKRLVDEPLPVKEGIVWSVAFSPDGKTIAAGYGRRSFIDVGEGGVVLWDVASRKRLVDEPLPVKEGDVKSVAFSPDGKTIAAGFDVRPRRRRGAVGRGRTQTPGRRATLREGGRRSERGLQPRRQDHRGRIQGPGRRRGRRAAVGSGRTQAPVGEPLPVKEGEVTSVALSPDGKTVAAGFERLDGRNGVVLWDVAARKRLVDEPLPLEEGGVTSVALSPDGKTIAAGYTSYTDGVYGGGVVLWDLPARGRLVGEPLRVEFGKVTSVALSPDGKIIAAGYDVNARTFDVRFGGVVLWDVAARKRLEEEKLRVMEGGVTSVAFSSDGKNVAAAYSSVINFDRRVRHPPGGGVVLWDVATRKRLVDKPLSVYARQVSSVAFSPDGKTIAAGYRTFVGAGGGVVLWDVATRERLVDLSLHENEGDVLSVAFSPDGKTIAAGYGRRSYSGGGGGGVVLWDVAARKRRVDERLSVEEGEVRSAAFSPDGKTIAAGFCDVVLSGVGGGGVVLWDVAARNRPVDELISVEKGEDTSVAFSRDGKTIAAGFYGSRHLAVTGSVVLCDVDLESWQRRAGEIANRNLTREEWRDYFPETPYRATFPDLPVPPEVAPN